MGRCLLNVRQVPGCPRPAPHGGPGRGSSDFLMPRERLYTWVCGRQPGKRAAHGWSTSESRTQARRAQHVGLSPARRTEADTGVSSARGGSSKDTQLLRAKKPSDLCGKASSEAFWPESGVPCRPAMQASPSPALGPPVGFRALHLLFWTFRRDGLTPHVTSRDRPLSSGSLRVLAYELHDTLARGQGPSVSCHLLRDVGAVTAS